MGQCRCLPEQVRKKLNVPKAAMGTLKCGVNGAFVAYAGPTTMLPDCQVVYVQHGGEADRAECHPS